MNRSFFGMARRVSAIAAVFIALAAQLAASSAAMACPFCPAQSQTLAEEIATADAAVLVKLTALASRDAASPDGAEEDPSLAEFEVTHIVGVSPTVRVGDKVRAIYLGDSVVGSPFLLFGYNPPEITWAAPTPLTARSQSYIKRIIQLPEDSIRLRFFQAHLEDPESLLAHDAYDEFARAPYDDIRAMKSEMDRDRLLKWARDPKMPANRRRLYLTMLGVCGGDQDIPVVEAMLKSKDRQLKMGLDAMIACYITLKGADGLPLIEDLFLKNHDAEYSDTYAAIMALRFHGTEGGVVSKEVVAKSMHCLLDRPSMADFVIADMARWEDWSQVDRLVELFKAADEDSRWVKVPVVRYLRACPLPEAKKHLEELAKLDPQTIERVNLFYPFDAPGKRDSKGDTGEKDPAEAAKAAAEEEGA